jgi:hypothetical protein
MTGRYDTAGNPEDQYYPGTSVLTNLVDIHDPEELLERETNYSSPHTKRYSAPSTKPSPPTCPSSTTFITRCSACCSGGPGVPAPSE